MGIVITAQPAPPGKTDFSLQTTPQHVAGWHAWCVDVTGNIITEFDSDTHSWDAHLPTAGLVVLLVRFTGAYDGAHPYRQVIADCALSSLQVLPVFSQFGTLVKSGALLTPTQYRAVLNQATPPG